MTLLDTADVPQAFTEAAHRYDRMVSLNPGYHQHLRTAAEALVADWSDRGSVRLVDLGCGSGASTRALVTAAAPVAAQSTVLGVDASEGMLAQAQAKTWPADVGFAQGLAQDLGARRAELGLDEPVDGVLAAYLFRNVAADERDAVLADVHALLADDGTLVVQEYSVAGSREATAIWTLVSWLVVVPLSWATTRKTRLYRYLWRSVCDFDSVQVFVDRLYAAGFASVEISTVPGWQHGILHTFRAKKSAGTA